MAFKNLCFTPNSSVIAFAIEVLPTPGGPYKINENIFLFLTKFFIYLIVYMFSEFFVFYFLSLFFIVTVQAFAATIIRSSVWLHKTHTTPQS